MPRDLFQEAGVDPTADTQAAGPRDLFAEAGVVPSQQAPGAPDQPSTGMQALRLAEAGSRGVMDSAAETLGAGPDAVARGLRTVGLPAPPVGYYTDKIKQGMNAVGDFISAPANALLNYAGLNFGPGQMSTAEKAAYGSGHGVGDAASILAPVTAVSKLAKAGGMVSGAADALAAQPIAQLASGAAGGAVGEATDNPWLGAGAALAVPLAGALASRAVTPITTALTPEQQRLAGVALDEGIPLTPAQRTGSRPLQTLESVFGKLPLTSGPQAAIADDQRQAFNQAVLSRAGISADYATPQVMAQGKADLQNAFQDLTAKTTVSLDDQFLGQVGDVASKYATKLPSQQRPVFDSYVNDILDSGDTMGGPTYQVTRSDLTRQAKSLTNNDPTLSTALRGLRDALDDAAGRSIPSPLQDAWNQTRQEYANYKILERAMANSTADATAGNVQPTQLAMAVRQANPNGYATGQGDLNDLARIGTTFIRDNVPNSGTPERMGITHLITGGLGGLMGHAAEGSSPLSAITTAAAGVATPRLIQLAYNTRPIGNYLANQLATGVGPQANGPLMAALLAERLKGSGLLPGN